MTETTTRAGYVKAAAAALAVLYAVAALVTLATATTRGGRSAAEPSAAAGALEQGPLGR